MSKPNTQESLAVAKETLASFVKHSTLLLKECGPVDLMCDSDRALAEKLPILQDALSALFNDFESGGLFRNVNIIKDGWYITRALGAIDKAHWVPSVNSAYSYEVASCFETYLEQMMTDECAFLYFLEDIRAGIVKSEVMPLLENMRKPLKGRLAAYTALLDSEPTPESTKLSTTLSFSENEVSKEESKMSPELSQFILLEADELIQNALQTLAQLPQWGHVREAQSKLMRVSNLILLNEENSLDKLRTIINGEQTEWCELFSKIKGRSEKLLTKIAYVLYCLFNFQFDKLGKVENFDWCAQVLERNRFFKPTNYETFRDEVALKFHPQVSVRA